MNCLTRWFISVPPRTEPKINYVAAFVEPNAFGGWSIRTSDDLEPLGNYDTASKAEAIARANFEDVRVIGETPEPSAA